MAKKETVNVEVKEIVSELNENGIYTIVFEGNEVEVSGNIANILIKKGKATLKQL